MAERVLIKIFGTSKGYARTHLMSLYLLRSFWNPFMQYGCVLIWPRINCNESFYNVFVHTLRYQSDKQIWNWISLFPIWHCVLFLWAFTKKKMVILVQYLHQAHLLFPLIFLLWDNCWSSNEIWYSEEEYFFKLLR